MDSKSNLTQILAALALGAALTFSATTSGVALWLSSRASDRSEAALGGVKQIADFLNQASKQRQQQQPGPQPAAPQEK